MPPTDNHNHNSGSFLNRISIRRNQITSVTDVNHEQELEELDLFQKHVTSRFLQLSQQNDETESVILLSISWFRNLLDAYLCCESEFKAVLIIGRDVSHFSKPPLDRLLPDHLDRTVKALDICNAITHGIELIRHWQRLAQIAVDALDQRPMVEGHVRRAKRALNTLLASMMVDDKEQNVHVGRSAERMWSIGRRGGGGGCPPTTMAVNHNRRISASRSFSSCFSKTWSASKQIQAMSTNLVVPRGGESTGLALPVYIMSSVLVFVMWTLVAAIPCQERAGLGSHFQLPKHLVWAGPIIGLQEKIGEEWKKKEKKGTAGLLDEIQVIEKVARNLVAFTEEFEFPVGPEKMDDVAKQVAELAEVCRKVEVGLGPLQLQVRELFHRMVRSRAEVLDLMDQVGKLTSVMSF
ncbi:protein ROH1A-like [Rutidosis leptorrhynchoides]|uniref:protein ROH1A-like n=1 Tax=Rutidosis leptorrhynchoides TaxID=125765 RepID=UPI003A98F789